MLKLKIKGDFIMANETPKKSRPTFKSFINLLAFVALVFIGLSLVLGLIFKDTGSIAVAFNTIAQVLSYMLVAYFSFLYVRTKRHWAYYVAWAVAITLIVVIVVLGVL